MIPQHLKGRLSNQTLTPKRDKLLVQMYDEGGHTVSAIAKEFCIAPSWAREILINNNRTTHVGPDDLTPGYIIEKHRLRYGHSKEHISALPDDRHRKLLYQAIDAGKTVMQVLVETWEKANGYE